MTAIDPDTGQYIEVPIEQAQYLVQDNSVVSSGKSLLKPDFAHSNRNSRITGGRKSQLSQSNSTMMSLVSQSTNSQIVHSQSMMGNTALMSSTLSVDRMANAIAGTVSRGRPRGRRPLRGQFPVVPIDMVRQLGIEQQVILQPAAPVAMRNKSLLCRPLCMSRRTQANIITNDMECQVDMDPEEDSVFKHNLTSTNIPKKNSTDTQTEKKSSHLDSTEEISEKVKYIPYPIPVPIYIPVPVATRVQPMPYICPVPLPIPFPISLLLTDIDQVTKSAKLTSELNLSKTSEDDNKNTLISSPTIGSKRSRLSSNSGTPLKKPRLPIINLESGVDAKHHLKFSFGINAWCHWTKQKNPNDDVFDDLQFDLVTMNPKQLNKCLTQFVTEVRKPNKESYVADSIFYLCLGIQEYLNIHSTSKKNIFNARDYRTFTQALNNILANFQPRISNDGLLICRIEEAHLWETDQLGSSDPYILLFTVVYFITKYFGLRTTEAHLNLMQGNFYATSNELVYVNYENKANILGRISAHLSCSIPVGGNSKIQQDRCPVSIIKNYICHYSIEPSKKSNFYGEIISEISKPWYSSSSPYDETELNFMLNRIKMVKEIQEAFMSSQHEDRD